MDGKNFQKKDGKFQRHVFIVIKTFFIQ